MGHLWHMDVSRKTRLRIFQSVIESILLYGSETWTLTKQMTLRLDGCYTKLLRYIPNIKYNLMLIIKYIMQKCIRMMLVQFHRY